MTLQDFNTRVVLGGATVLGVACGVVGVLAMLRRRALMGDAIAHAALPGVCLAFLVAGGRFLPALLAGAAAFGLLAVLAVTLVRRASRVKEDAAIALTLSVFFGLGIALLTSIQRRTGSDHAGLDGFIFGKAAGMTARDLLVLGAVSVVVLGVVAGFLKEFTALCFDATFAASIGRSVTLLDVLLMALVCLATVAALPAVGAVLVVALLTIPPATARFWTDRLPTMLVVSGTAGGTAGAVGAAVSSLVPKVSAGPVITLAAAALFMLSMFLAPRHGILPRLVRQRRNRRFVAEENRRVAVELSGGGA
jgi:manganese/zinc/iron transport system permease protein